LLKGGTKKEAASNRREVFVEVGRRKNAVLGNAVGAGNPLLPVGGGIKLRTNEKRARHPGFEGLHGRQDTVKNRGRKKKELRNLRPGKNHTRRGGLGFIELRT